ncbi:glycosyltransferase [Candidatus Saccharibacteria bacterium]|nr:glycosyltransferase [Candidatus Saccharibacteria bacterium]
MKVLVVGGGSGGHITPAVAVVREILEEKPRARVEFWTDRKYYKNVVKITTEIGVAWGDEERLSGRRQYVRVRKIAAGKFRRYAGWTVSDYFKNWDTTLKDLVVGNFCGLIGFISGIFQSFWRMLLKKNRPDVVFLKGGFVGLPVGIVARFFRIPYVIHESDATPGLANRLLMKHASRIALALNSPNASAILSDKSIVTGVPVAPEFKKVSETKQKQLKKAFGFDEDKPLVVITGGSQGAQHINEAVRDILPEMLKFASVGLVAGRGRYEEMVDLKKYEDWDKAKLKSNFRMWAFNSAMHELMGAADVVVSRAGATTIAELAALSKAVVLVPFEQLPGSHQVKNAERLLAMDAVKMVKDSRMVQQPGILLETVQKLVRSPKLRKDLAARLHETYKPKAAEDLAKIVIELANTGGEDAKK